MVSCGELKASCALSNGMQLALWNGERRKVMKMKTNVKAGGVKDHSI
jgi:hypothetical protein